MTRLMKVEGKAVDLSRLYANIKKMLEDEKFRIVKDDVTENAYHIRALKTQITRIIVGATRDVEIVVAGDPDNFAVVLIVGAWGKNLAISGATGFIVASTIAAPAVVVGTVAAAGSYLTAIKFEEQLYKRIEDEIRKQKKQSTRA
ncbi:MAG TPA: hypothetical protein VMW03_02265 [Candidatus Krumholzibacteriaceae bacterium]|nr:hypothetical protein [Candidatus Krumholzibacteriaceae bacterium]